MGAVEILRKRRAGGNPDAIGLSSEHEAELPFEFAPHFALDFLADADHVEMAERTVLDFGEISNEIRETLFGIIVKSRHEFAFVRNPAGRPQRQVFRKTHLPFSKEIRRRGKQAFYRNGIERTPERIDPLFDGRRPHAVIVGGDGGIGGPGQSVVPGSLRPLAESRFRVPEIHVEIR